MEKPHFQGPNRIPINNMNVKKTTYNFIGGSLKVLALLKVIAIHWSTCGS